MSILARAVELLVLTIMGAWCLVWYAWLIALFAILIFAGIVPTIFDILNGGI